MLLCPFIRALSRWELCAASSGNLNFRLTYFGNNFSKCNSSLVVSSPRSFPPTNNVNFLAKKSFFMSTLLFFWQDANIANNKVSTLIKNFSSNELQGLIPAAMNEIKRSRRGAKEPPRWSPSPHHPRRCTRRHAVPPGSAGSLLLLW